MAAYGKYTWWYQYEYSGDVVSSDGGGGGTGGEARYAVPVVADTDSAGSGRGPASATA